MNKQEALELDHTGEFYVDFDEDTNLWYIFGSESGFAYSSWSDEESANEELKQCVK